MNLREFGERLSELKLGSDSGQSGLYLLVHSADGHGVFVIGIKRADADVENSIYLEPSEKVRLLNEPRGSLQYVQYEHHGQNVAVRKDLKGKHRDFCLCHSCKLFNPGSEDNCPTARSVYKNCVKHGIVTPVWECPLFQKKSDKTTKIPFSVHEIIP